MLTKDAIKDDVVKFGRLTEAQENILNNIAMRQEDYGYEPTHMLLSDLEKNETLQELIRRQFLGYVPINPGSKQLIVSLFATVRGVGYCVMFADEISVRKHI